MGLQDSESLGRGGCQNVEDGEDCVDTEMGVYTMPLLNHGTLGLDGE